MSVPKRVLLPSLIDELPLPPTPTPDLRLNLPQSPAAPFDTYTQSPLPLQQPASPSHPQPCYSSSSLPIPFTPLFTLISTTTATTPSTARAAPSPEHHHPTVHYIFSDDDDSDLITEAALLSLHSLDPTTSSPGLTTSASRSTSRVLDRRKHAHLTRQSTEDGSDADNDGEDLSSLSRTNTLRAHQKGGRERYIVLDVVPTQPFPNTTLPPADTTLTSLNPPVGIGTPTPVHPSLPPPNDPPFIISAAHSLDPDFAVLSTSLCPAPTFEHDADTPAPSQSGWMLNISGIMTAGPASAANAEKVPPGVTVEALDDLAERFEREMGVLRSIMGRSLPSVDLRGVEGERILWDEGDGEGEEHGERLIAETEGGVEDGVGDE